MERIVLLLPLLTLGVMFIIFVLIISLIFRSVPKRNNASNTVHLQDRDVIVAKSLESEAKSVEIHGVDENGNYLN